MGLAAILVEGLDELWARDPEQAGHTLEALDRCIASALSEAGGYGVRLTEGSVKAAFVDLDTAIGCCRAVLQGVARDPGLCAATVRAAVALGPVRLRPDTLTDRLDLTGATVAALLARARATPAGRIGGPEGLVAELSVVALPPEMRSFHGRTTQLEALLERLAQPGVVLVVGPGGSGKSRLACRAAALAHQARPLPGGAWFVELAHVTTEAQLIRTVASSLELALPEAADLDALQRRLATRLRHRGSTLIVLDNLEQVAEPAQRLLERWTQLAPLRCLATSRVALQLDGAHQLSLGALPDAAALELLDARASALGVHRWTARGAEGAALELVRALDGLPLALELAAARSRIATPEQLLAWLEQPGAQGPGGAPGPGGGAGLQRHEALHCVVAWSLDLLEPPIRTALARLSVLCGPFTLAEATAVVGDGSAVEVLDRLLDAALIRPVTLQGDPGWILYGAVRRHAAGELGEGAEAHAVQLRLAELLLGGVHAWRFGLWRGDRPAQLQFVARHQAALHRLLRLGGRNGALAALRLSPWYDLHLPTQSRLELLDEGLGCALRAGEPQLVALLLAEHARALQLRGRLEQAEADVDEALGLMQGQHDPGLEGRLLQRGGVLATMRSQLQRAEARLHQALELALASGDAVLESSTLAVLGRTAEASGDLERASALYRRALERLEGTPEALTLAKLTGGFGDFLLRRAEVDQALVRIRRAVEDLDRLQHPRLLGAARIVLSRGLVASGELEDAGALIEEELARSRQLGLGIREGYLLLDHAGVRALQERYGDAEVSLTEALARYESVQGPRAEVRACRALIRLLRGDRIGARQDALEALADSEQRSGLAGGVLAVICASEGDRSGAHEVLHTAREHAPPSSTPLLALVEAAIAPQEGAAETTAAPGSDPGDPWAQLFPRVLERSRLCPGRRASLQLSTDGARVITPAGDTLDLARRGALRRILVYLAEQRLAAPGAAQPLEVVFAAGWPGERVMPTAATNRVYVAIATLRKLGLAELLLTNDDGYLIDPVVPVTHLPTG